MASSSSSSHNLPPKKYKIGDGKAVRAHEIYRANILLIGQTGSGKTTFLNTLKNPSYRSSFQIGSQTSNASLHDLGFKIGGEYYSLSVIDTPGFSDTTSRSDMSIKNLILEFVKKGVTSLNMVLIALPMNRRIDAAYMETINGVILFLGPEMADVTYILGTHSEGRTDQEKRAWAKQLYESPLRILVKYTKKKFVWSGMVDDRLSGEEARKGVIEMKRNQENTLKKAVSSTPVVLTLGDEVKEIQHTFKMYESAAKDGLTLELLLPKMTPLAASVSTTLKDLVQASEKSRVDGFLKKATSEAIDKLCDKYSGVNQAKMQEQCEIWKTISSRQNEYIKVGQRLGEAATEVQELHERLHQALLEMRTLTTSLAVLPLDQDEDGSSDEEFDID